MKAWNDRGAQSYPLISAKPNAVPPAIAKMKLVKFPLCAFRLATTSGTGSTILALVHGLLNGVLSFYRLLLVNVDDGPSRSAGSFARERSPVVASAHLFLPQYLHPDSSSAVGQRCYIEQSLS
ncbi:hypothetical protein RvY_04711 [Ramazzottius varieornatus]|uniref:Uncharacterized protein n=1 Tax=Ramazzottius varieornatus TaxID=947166 RepID=A0A1D1UY80_RAMVA|nr:hypothetical protein RvY_04711 [Ramazzottius varieornatus]